MTIGGEALFRHELGGLLRRRRQERGERLADTAARAGISPQYLSEIERGLKDPSSEMLAAIAGALGTGVGALAVEVGRRLGAARPVLRLDRTARPAAGPVTPEPAAPAPRLLALAA